MALVQGRERPRTAASRRPSRRWPEAARRVRGERGTRRASVLLRIGARPVARNTSPIEGPPDPGRSAGAALLAIALALARPIDAWAEETPATPEPPTVPSEPESRAPEAPPGTDAPPALEPGPPASPAGSAPPAPAPAAPQESWVDTSHDFVSHGFLWAIVSFDRFFADEREVDLPHASSFARWRNVLTLRGSGTVAYAPDLRAEAVLPSFNRRLDRLRLRLTVATTTPEAIDPLVPAALLPPDVPHRPSAGLQLTPLESPKARTDIQVGLLMHHPVGWYARTRFRKIQPIGDGLVARLALVGFWQSDIGFGTRQDLSLEHPLSPRLLVRFAGGSMIAQHSRGLEWSSEVAVLAAVWPRTALLTSAGALGASKAGPGVEVWRLQARARRDLFRRWLFLEIAPEMVWTRRAAGDFRRASAVIVRLEIQFEAAGPSQPAVGTP
jgi:hypothetical protein